MGTVLPGPRPAETEGARWAAWPAGCWRGPEEARAAGSLEPTATWGGDAHPENG